MSNDDAYIAAIKEVIPCIDLVLFVTPLNETRVSRDERIALRSLSSAIGKQLWENMIVLFSFSCSQLPGDSAYSTFFDERIEAFREFVAQLSADKISQNLPFLAVDNRSKVNPDGHEWVPELFTLIVERCSSAGVIPFVEALAADIGGSGSDSDAFSSDESREGSTYSEPKRINLNDEQKQRVKSGLKRSVIGGAILGAIAGVIAVPGAAVIGAPVLILGGAAGAALGFWRWLSKK
jgi:hypothetical protein